MKTINRKMIQELFPDPVYERGLQYYYADRVEGVSYNTNKEAWFAEVVGTEPYYVEVVLKHLDAGRIITFCDCPAFDTYETCKHIVAVLLEVSDREPEKEQVTVDVMSYFMDSIIEIDNHLDVISEKIPMQIAYELKVDYDEKVWLELKTGIDHLYVVRQVREFLQAILANEKYYFTKKFTYQPTEHYFLKQDLDILKVLADFITTGDLYTERSYYSHNAYDKRSLLVPSFAFKPLLKQLQERKTKVEIAGDQALYDQYELVSETVPYAFTISKNEAEQLSLRIDGMEKVNFNKAYQFAFSAGTFYFPTMEQLSLLEKMQSIGVKGQALPIADADAGVFFSEALPVLKKVSEVNIDEKVADELVEFPLRAKMYLEQAADAIVGTLTYHYGQYELNPFYDTRKEPIIIRDVEKEQKIMHMIEESNFHYNGKALYIHLTDDEAVYDFLYTNLPKLADEVELFLAEEIQRMLFDEDPFPTMTVDVTESTNLLEVGFDITGVDEAEIQSVIAAVIEKDRYYRLADGTIFSLENEAYDSMRQFFNQLDVSAKDMQDGKLALPAYRSMQVDELLETEKTYYPAFRKLLEQLKHPEEQWYELPEALQAELRAYQTVGYQWFKTLSHYQLGGILADDMGLGKTLQTIAYILSEPSDLPHLIVVPSSVVYNWRNECAKFAPTLEVAVISGTAQERKALIEAAADADVWITSYNMLRQDIDLLVERTFQTLVLDEAQFIKNYATKTSQAVRQIKATRRFALSGTPIENTIDELWAIFQVILPGLMPGLRKFRQLEAKTIASLTRPFILRRLKEDVLKELPEKIESVHIASLTEEQKTLYLGYLQQLQTDMTASLASNNFQENRMKILAGLTRLRQICCHPSLFMENYDGESGKLAALLETIETMLANGRRMLIFSQFTSMHEIIIEHLKARGIDYFYLHGQTPAQDRVEMSEAFNNGEKEVFLISLRAGGTGLNLTGADTVILYDLWWNPAVEDQATGRAYRFGQKNVVQVVRFITEGTIEEKIYALQQKKRELINQVIQPGEKMLASLSEEDIKTLLNL